ncbi:hypothetical protein PIB30_085635 [Stylosanthes scabra]|uniref:Aminotransferase-like plant mobile domain-containing protein n=1 Tax=Stylosanthes scabra TaxID=79078 RepID=A0ABU6ZRK4_9FABA|nr:hypothetical protein [Stylosanthes scabra]
MPDVADEGTWRQYARCYILLFIGGYLMPDTSSNLVHIRWVPLLRDLDEYAGVVVGECCACMDVPIIVRCCEEGQDRHSRLPSAGHVLDIPQIYALLSSLGGVDCVASSQLIGFQQPDRDRQEGRLLRWREELDRSDIARFRWTPYNTHELQAIVPDWIRSHQGRRTTTPLFLIRQWQMQREICLSSHPA